MKKDIFHFKKFTIKQDRCAMKVGTDAVLLATIPCFDSANTILDIGTGTGVISLMLAQQMPLAKIDAVEIDSEAAEQAKDNFEASSWRDRIKITHTDFESFSSPTQYDLIVTNPPYFINALQSETFVRNVARHQVGRNEEKTMSSWLKKSVHLLNTEGSFAFIYPYNQFEFIKSELNAVNLYTNRIYWIHSFTNTRPIRVIFITSFQPTPIEYKDFIIYKEKNNYSDEYAFLMKDYLTIF